jgi:hypothetical protein
MSQDTTPVEQDQGIEPLRVTAIRELRDRFEAIITLFDLPLERLTKTTYESREQMVHAMIGTAVHPLSFAVQIGLITGGEVRALMAEYRDKRPDVFGNLLSAPDPD